MLWIAFVYIHHGDSKRLTRHGWHIYTRQSQSSTQIIVCQFHYESFTVLPVAPIINVAIRAIKYFQAEEAYTYISPKDETYAKGQNN